MLGYQLVQDQRLKLAMTPELQQSMHILTLSGQELMQYVQEQVMQNPVLELEEHRGSGYSQTVRSTHARRMAYDSLWQAQAASESLEQSVLSQLRLLELTPDVRRTAVYLTGNLNEDGYLDMDLADVCSVLHVSIGLAEEALRQVQSVEPAGIGGRDLRECLLLQIERDSSSARGAREIVAHYLEDLAHGQWGAIASSLRMSRAQVKAAAQYIQRLQPRPGQSIGASIVPYVVPDAMVELKTEGYMLHMHPFSSPRLAVSELYHGWAGNQGSAVVSEISDASAFLQTRIKSAAWVIRCVALRRQTLQQVMHAILEEQIDFLTAGVKGIRPMTLAVIASRLGIHESTVSRAVNGKHLQTPHGVFPLKYFFSSGLPTREGMDTSAQAVKARIRAIIAGENKDRPLSDQHIADLLTKEGIQISRRTVAKYRDGMQLLAAGYRKTKI
ncbi:RNA polymerase factor sigma-54 [Paenibacillus terrigena]|uniref:RNA polymerase factor sigma-54 n=1 Tax=Paenibacillus terrigena TaxID=369333 RepID=UPI00036F349D|nr:RNA polymerase factor sigma-54 [Paenibacillus terrigena]